jgi:hypothetical protein
LHPLMLFNTNVIKEITRKLNWFKIVEGELKWMINYSKN